VGESEIGSSASMHGGALLRLGFTVDQVVHNYGDLCQSITDLAFEEEAAITVKDFRTLNRCLDNAIADAVTEYSLQRDLVIANGESISLNQRMGFLVHELRNGLNTATLAVTALEAGKLSISGATGEVLKRSLVSLKGLLDHTFDEVRKKAPRPMAQESIKVVELIQEAEQAGHLDAATKGCTLRVDDVNHAVHIRVHRDSMLAAVGNLLHNAFKFTHSGTEVRLSAKQLSGRVLIEVSDHCGGLPHGNTHDMFKPFVQKCRPVGLGIRPGHRPPYRGIGWWHFEREGHARRGLHVHYQPSASVTR
jgi:signal transduction histidine kinase